MLLYTKLVYLFHALLLAPLFIYAGWFIDTSPNRNLVITLVMYSGLSALLYHTLALLKLWAEAKTSTAQVLQKEDAHIYGFHLLIAPVFLYMLYEYVQYNEVSCATLGAVGGMGVIALAIHGGSLLMANAPGGSLLMANAPGGSLLANTLKDSLFRATQSVAL